MSSRHHAVPSPLRRLTPTAFAAIVGLGLALAVARPATVGADASDQECDHPKSYTWNGEGTTNNWDDEENWTPKGVPGPEDDATIAPFYTEEGDLELPVVESGPESVCDLTVSQGGDTVKLGQLEVKKDLTLDGGEGSEGTSLIEGHLIVDETATLSGKLFLEGGGITSAELLVVEGNASVTLGGSPTNLEVDGTALVGNPAEAPTIASDESSVTNDNSKLVVNGEVVLLSDLNTPHMDVNLNHESSIDLNDRKWTVSGLSFSRWKSGAEIESTVSGGAIEFEELAQLLIDGAPEIDSGTTVVLGEESTLGDGALEGIGEPLGTTGLLRGAGQLEWRGGSLERQLQLAPGFHSVVAGGGAHLVDKAGTRLINEGTLEVKAGTLEVEGPPASLKNQAVLKVDAGQALTCGTSTCAGGLDNAPEGTIGVVPSAAHPAETTASAEELGIDNDGKIAIGSGLFLTAKEGAAVSLAEAGSIEGPGTLRIGEAGTANVVGTTSISGAATLALNGEQAELHGGTVNSEGAHFAGSLTAPAAGGGALRWVNGGVEGTLRTAGQLQVLLTGTAGRHAVDPETRDSHHPTRNPTLLTLASPASDEGGPFEIESEENGDAVAVDSSLTLDGPKGGFIRGDTDADGVIVDPQGTLSAQGTAAIEAPLALAGRLQVPTGATLKTPLGYTQSGASADTSLEGGRIVSGAPLELNGGRLGGPGTIRSAVANHGATVAPAGAGGAPAKLDIEGAYSQSPAGTLGLLIDGPGESQHDTVQATGAVQLAGALQVTDGGGYQPAAGASVPGVVIGPTVSGSFATVSSTGAPAETEWQPAFGSGTLNLNLVAAPAHHEEAGTQPPPAGDGTGQPKKLKCRKGFKKRKVHGKTKCVKKRKARHTGAHAQT